MSNEFTIKGRLVDIRNRQIKLAVVTVNEGLITAIDLPDEKHSNSSLETIGQAGSKPDRERLPFILPGFVDSHVHIESSMLIPSEFGRLAVVHGTVGTVSDPHEIANVCGIAGIDYMIADGKRVPFKFNFGAPSCVPATVFETAGAAVDVNEVTALLSRKEIKYLSEMMNFPGVLYKDDTVMKKIAAAHAAGKPVDGHAPGLRGDKARDYIAAGISTDHECFTAEEALDKLAAGMKILIREGSAAKNFEALIGLLKDYPESIMFCSDDKHPDSLVAGHINILCARAVARGIDVFNVLQAACINPVEHYKLDIGQLKKGDPADFILVSNLEEFKVLKTYIDGQLVADNGVSKIVVASVESNGLINNFHCIEQTADAFAIADTNTNHDHYTSNIIEVLDGQLVTNKLTGRLNRENGFLSSNLSEDILKIAVINRYAPAAVAVAFIKNFGLKQGALASSVAHDSHNIVVVGVDDESIARAVNLVIQQNGGISCVGAGNEKVIALPVAGLMTNRDGYLVADEYTEIDRMAKHLGSTLASPFMSLSFMALLVIPSLKISDLGIFDGESFSLIRP